MFKNEFHKGYQSIFYSIGSKPLQLWETKVKNGHVKKVMDNDLHSTVLELEGINVHTTYVTCPANLKNDLGISLPFLVMLIKNQKKEFSFEVQVMDDQNIRRRFRASNYHTKMQVSPFSCSMPMDLDDGWNKIQFDLSDFTKQAFGTNYVNTQRVQIHANCRIRRVYFSDKIYSEEELPDDYGLYSHVQKKK